MLPTFRPDALLTAKSPAWRGAVDALAKSEGIPIRSLGDCERALLHSLDRFVRAGCRMSDHGFEHLRYTDPAGAEAAFSRAMAGAVLTEREAASLSSHLLRFLGGAYADRGLTMQLHVGAVRNGSTRLFRQLGADAGGDSADDPGAMRGLLPLLDSLDCAGRLPKIILYCLNECDYPACVTMAASFRKPGVVNPVQLGAAWWFNDTERGIRKQLTLLMENAMLPGFCGMLTDSRSLTSFVRHDYFRRILCDLVGGELENGNFVNLDAAKRLIRNVCCANPAACLGMDAGEGAG